MNKKGTEAALKKYFNWLLVITLMLSYVQGRLVNASDWYFNQKNGLLTRMSNELANTSPKAY